MKRRRSALVLPQTTRLGTVRRRGLYALVAVLVGSGAAWLWLHFGRSDDTLPSPLEPWLMKIHGAATMLIVYLAGTMLFGHMVTAWQRGQNRGGGSVAAAALLVLAGTGYGLYYFGGETLRRGTEWLHWGVGFALPVLLAWHVRRGRRAIARAAREGSKAP